MKPFTLPRFGDIDQDRISDALEDAIGDLVSAPLADARVLAPQLVGVTDTRIYHGLERRPVGYFVAKAPADVRVFDGATAEANDPSHFITLRASSAQTVTLVVF